VKACEEVVAMAANNKSPLAVVVTLPVLGVVELPCAVTGTPSSELLLATPEYSRIAMRNGPAIDCETVMVFAPALIFSA
jgi:hypothetical protein